MTTYYSNELAGTTTGLTETPAVGVRPSAEKGYFARLKLFRATITFAAQAAGSTFVLANVPAGMSFVSGNVVTTDSTASAKFSIGTAASVAKYRAAAVLTSTNSPTAFGLRNITAGAYSAEETVILTVSNDAALPASGTLVVDLICASAN